MSGNVIHSSSRRTRSMQSRRSPISLSTLPPLCHSKARLISDALQRDIYENITRWTAKFWTAELPYAAVEATRVATVCYADISSYA